MNNMHNSKNNDQETKSPAVALGLVIRSARKKRGLTIQALADELGRTREWLNRVELGYSEYGEYKPPSQADISRMFSCMEGCFDDTEEKLLELRAQAEYEYMTYKTTGSRQPRSNFGKLTQTEIICGEKQIVDAITTLIEDQHSDAIIRNTGIKSLGNYQKLTPEWKNYRFALGKFLTRNPNGLFKRVEYAATSDQLQKAKEADEKLAYDRELHEVHNAKIKFHIQNPLQLHVVIGQREAILALPQNSGQAGSNVALLIKDRVFVEALRTWYDEVLWDAPTKNTSIDFANFDDSFKKTEVMYRFKNSDS